MVSSTTRKQHGTFMYNLSVTCDLKLTTICIPKTMSILKIRLLTFKETIAHLKVNTPFYSAC